MQVRQGRINFTTLAELPDGASVMSGTFSIHHKPVVTLFDSGATHSFISNNCGTRIGLDPCFTQGSYMISTPGGNITSNQMIKSVPIQLGSKEIKTDLVLLSLEGIDIILGTNWMTKHQVRLDITILWDHHPIFASARMSTSLHLCHHKYPSQGYSYSM
jgi:hypothetical protein